VNASNLATNGNKNLVKSMAKFRSTGFAGRKFPKLNNIRPSPNKYVYNDYHSRSTAGGFARNINGNQFCQ
jgi:hypothetical protein